MPPTVCGNQCRDGRRHLVFGRRQHAGLVALRREVADPRCWRLVSLWWPGPGGGAQWARWGRGRPGKNAAPWPGHERSRQARRRPACAVQEPHGPHRVPCSPSAGYRAGVSLVIHVIHSALGYRAPVGQRLVVSKVCSIRCGGACLHRRRSLILMSCLNAMGAHPDRRGHRHPRPTTGSQRRPTAVLMWNGLSSGRLVLVASGLFGVSGFDPMTGPCGAPSTPPRRLKGARPRCHPQGITCVGCYCR